MSARLPFTVDSLEGNRVVLVLHKPAFDLLQLQGVESPQFVTRVAGVDGYGLWVENPRFCSVPKYSDGGEYIPPEERLEVCDRALILIMWSYVQTIIAFPDRETHFGPEAEETEIGFRPRPAGVQAAELAPIGVGPEQAAGSGAGKAPRKRKGKRG